MRPKSGSRCATRSFYRSIDVELVSGDAATSLDLAGASLTLESGRRLDVRCAALATGAEPVRLPHPRRRSPSRARAAHSRRQPGASSPWPSAGRRAVVVGASFIGLEVAASLRARQVEVDVVAPESVPLGRIVGEEVGAFVRRLHEDRGVRFHLGRKPAAIEGAAVALDDGTTLGCDFVVLGVGVRPRLALAEAAGLAVDRGVVVDELLRAADGVWAAGDVARYPDPRSGRPIRVEHWVAAERMGQAAARNLLGAAQPYRDAPFFWSAHYDVTLRYVGHAEAWDSFAVHGDLERRDALVAYREAGRVAAVLTVGRDHTSLEVEAAMDRGDDAALERLVRG